jgi:lipopolysaccharide export system permease protein
MKNSINNKNTTSENKFLDFFSLTIIDKYILKRYLSNFSIMLLLFIPIGIIIDVSEKVNKMVENKVELYKILKYYFYFTIYFANFLFPIFLFLSIIWFTSKLANNTEIIAILSSGISFNRFLKPYFVGATIISCFALLMGFFLAPKAADEYNTFRFTYLFGNGLRDMRQNEDVYRQISENEYIYVSNFNTDTKTAYNFSFEHFNKDKTLQYKVTASRIQWNENKKNFTMYDYAKRTVGNLDDKLERMPQKDQVFSFDLDDITPVIFIAETLPVHKLYNFIEKERKKGNANINVYLVVFYKKFSVPISAFILTIIAVAVSSMKRRGGMGINLTIGILVAFGYVFFDKIFGVLAEKSTIPPMLAVWIPNMVFGVLALYLLRNARR